MTAQGIESSKTNSFVIQLVIRNLPVRGWSRDKNSGQVYKIKDLCFFINVKQVHMKKYILLMVMFFSVTAFAADKGTWTGYISDAHCGAKGNNDGHADCAKKCVKNGYCLLYTSDAADEEDSVDLGGRR